MTPGRVVSAFSLVVLALLLTGRPAAAENARHGYASLGAGATDISGGAQWPAGQGRLGLGWEVGVGWVFLAAAAASYHFTTADARRYDAFVRVGYAHLGSGELSSHGVTLGGGAVFWAAPRIGIRLDAFKYLPVATDYEVPPDDRSRSRFWAIRAGVAFRIG